MVSHLVRDELVQRFHGRRGHAANEVIEHARLVQVVRIEEHVRELEVRSAVREIVAHALEAGLEQAVAEPEGGRGELVEDGGVAAVVVAAVVAFR